MPIDPAAAQQAAAAVPSLPRDGEGPVFREPWEAQAFAMALALHARGLFTWNEWAAMLADEIKRAQAAGDADTGELDKQRAHLAMWNHRRKDTIGAGRKPEMPQAGRSSGSVT